MSGTAETIGTIVRPGITIAEGPYADAGAYAEGFTDNGLPKVGAYAGVGVGHLKDDHDGVETEVNGPNASAGAQASLAHGVSAICKAGVGSVSVASGPLKATAGLGVDTGVSVGPDGVEVLLLGNGIRIGPNPKISVLGSSVECSVM